MKRTNILLILALVLGLAFHGSAIFFTLEDSYDAYIHLFFSNHYAENWFEHWNYKWYTGFTVHAYPPLVHQIMALLSYIGGLKFGLYAVALFSVILFITGIYRYGLLLSGSRKIAGYSSLLAVLSTAFIETLHLFGQLPSIIGLSLLLHALPDIYQWIRSGEFKFLFRSLSLIAVMVTSHHVTPIFGMVFFVFPLIGMALIDHSKDWVGDLKKVTLALFYRSFKAAFWRITTFGITSLALIVICILPYWLNTRENPITQVPIPHGSRDNFLEVTSSGLVFFIVPWGILLFLFPFIFYRLFSKRYLFFGLSLSLLTLLGTGGTTALPALILGENAFNILTLDRFTLWATIMVLPIFGEFIYRLIEGDLKIALQNKFGSVYHRIIGGMLASVLLVTVILTMSLGYFRPAQPQKIKMLPIVNFLNQDQHDQWRYLTLGFGDQMAWLSALTNAKTVDGNYHSARRLPELTSRAIERLENSKFKGVEGIGSLQQFLTVPEKYHLKYIFSNDKFYDPILYFCGWQRINQLENGIMVWERLNVPPLPSMLPKEDVPKFLKLLWGLIPLAAVIIAFLLNIQSTWWRALKVHKLKRGIYELDRDKFNGFPGRLLHLNHIWGFSISALILFSIYHYYVENAHNSTPENVVKAYYDAIDFKEFERAFSYLDPKADITQEQYMLELSVTDGIISSYAKLDSIGIRVLRNMNSKARAIVHTKWITPLETIEKTFSHDLVLENKRWYLSPHSLNSDIPPDQLFIGNKTTFYNQGRRRITTQQTHHEDILEQPQLKVLSAKLVQFNSRYSIVGEIQNVDWAPADVVVKASLYGKDNLQLAHYNAKYHIKHKLMPREITPFRIDFEGVAWSDSLEKVPLTFDPEHFTPAIIEKVPLSFDIQCAGNITNSDLYKSMALQQMKVKDDEVEGIIFNSGVQEITIPQILVSYYNDDGSLLWVDHHFLPEGIRVQRKKVFHLRLADLNKLVVLKEKTEHCFVNGLPNEMSGQVDDHLYREQQAHVLQPLEGKGYTNLKIDLNAYIGNPR